jgi:hypothetical protein
MQSFHEYSPNIRKFVFLIPLHTLIPLNREENKNDTSVVAVSVVAVSVAAVENRPNPSDIQQADGAASSSTAASSTAETGFEALASSG